MVLLSFHAAKISKPREGRAGHDMPLRPTLGALEKLSRHYWLVGMSIES